MNHEETIYGPDAKDFNPRRFLDIKGELRAPIPDTKDEGHVTYGFGRRQVFQYCDLAIVSSKN